MVSTTGIQRSRRTLTVTVAVVATLVISLAACPGSAEETADKISPPAEGQPAKSPETDTTTDAKSDPCREYRENCPDSTSEKKIKSGKNKNRVAKSAKQKKREKENGAHGKAVIKAGTKDGMSGAVGIDWQSLCSGERLTADQVRQGMKGAKDFSGKNLGGLNLLAFNLRGANLAGTCLAGVNLERADLTEANLKRAVLSGANLTLASVQLANLDGAELDGAIFDETVWTDGHVCRKGSIGSCLDIFDTPGR